jgi:hypothetical protein
MKITVTAIGTCRVHLPFFRLARRGGISYDQRGMYGRTHTSKEALQILRVMGGDLVLPPELRPFIMSRAHHVNHPKARLNDLTGTDVLVVELSSAKEIIFREFFFQLVLTRKRLWATRSQSVREWWQAFSSDGTDVEDRAAVLGNDELPPAEAAFVSEGNINLQGPDEIRADMAAIAERFAGPILFVTHFDTPTPNGGPNVHGRADMIRAMKEAGAELECRVYDPSTDVLAYAAGHGGQSAAISGPFHFTDAFIDELLIDKIHAEALAAIEMAR